MVAAIFSAVACGAGNGADEVRCDLHASDARVVRSSATSTALHVAADQGCGDGTQELLFIKLPSAEAPLGPAMRDGSYAVIWSTDKPSFDRTLDIDHSVALEDGDSADLGEGNWILGLRQGGTISAQPLPEGF
jgi:hypothetical protein